MTLDKGRFRPKRLKTRGSSVVITGIDNQKVLEQAFEAIKTFQPLDEKEVAAILTKTERAAADGKFELFKTSAHFDTTAKHADWLGDDSAPVCAGWLRRVRDDSAAIMRLR